MQRIINKAGKLTKNTIKYLFKNAISNRKLIVLAAQAFVYGLHPHVKRFEFAVFFRVQCSAFSKKEYTNALVHVHLLSGQTWTTYAPILPMPTSPDRWCTSSVYWVQVISWMLILCRIQYKSLSPEAFSHDGFNTFNTSRWFEQSKECLLDVT